MSGYRIKQTACIIIGLIIGLWIGNFVWHALARSQAEELVKQYKGTVEEFTKEVEKKWSEYTFSNLWSNLLIYGIAGALGIGAGVLVAESTGGERDKT